MLLNLSFENSIYIDQEERIEYKLRKERIQIISFKKANRKRNNRITYIDLYKHIIVKSIFVLIKQEISSTNPCENYFFIEDYTFCKWNKYNNLIGNRILQILKTYPKK